MFELWFAKVLNFTMELPLNYCNRLIRYISLFEPSFFLLLAVPCSLFSWILYIRFVCDIEYRNRASNDWIYAVCSMTFKLNYCDTDEWLMRRWRRNVNINRMNEKKRKRKKNRSSNAQNKKEIIYIRELAFVHSIRIRCGLGEYIYVAWNIYLHRWCGHFILPFSKCENVCTIRFKIASITS